METKETAIRGRLAAQKLPRWDELPDIELYMDQLLGLIRRYLGTYPGFDEKGLTASMVNNYVKQGVVPSPVKKRYGREQLSRLIIVCLLKSSFPIAAIRRLLEGEQVRHSPAELYNMFCDKFESAVVETAGPAEADAGGSPYTGILRAALRAQAERALALQLFAEVFPEEKAEKPEKKK